MLKNKMILIAIMVVLSAALVGGYTMAWFTDSDSAEAETFAAGTVLIEAGSNSITSQYFDPADGVFVYGVIGQTGDLYEIDVQNQRENLIFENPNNYSSYYPNALAFDAVNDRLYFAANKNTLWFYDFSQNKLVNAGAIVQAHGSSNDVYGATFGDGYFWYVPNGTAWLYKVAFDDAGTVVSSEKVLMTENLNFRFGDIELDYADGIIYGSDLGRYFTYNTRTLVFTDLGSTGKNLQLAWGHDGVLYGHSTSDDKWYSVNQDSGVKTEIFQGELTYNDLASSSKSVWNPGDCAWAKFNVKNVGTKNSYVRVTLSDSWMKYDDGTGQWLDWVPDHTDCPDSCTGGEVVEITPGTGMDDWKKDGDYYYFNKVLMPNETAELCLKVCLKGPETCNEYQGKRFVITGEFDAIQTTHGASEEVWSWSPDL